MSTQTIFEDEFPDGPNGKRANIYPDVVEKYLIRACNDDGIHVRVFDTSQERCYWLERFSIGWDSVMLFDLSELYKYNGEVLRPPLT